VNSGKHPPFMMMLHKVFDSEEYRALTSLERDILWLLIRRHNGRNNGGISLGVREAAAWCHCGKTTAHRALRRLEQTRFVTTAHKGHLVPIAARGNVATTWRLNFVNVEEKADATHNA
jgi:hypothetical protein